MKNTSNLESYVIQKHTISQSIFYHIVPGILIGLFYFLMVPYVRYFNYPTIAALVLAGIFVLIPLELGVIYYNKKKPLKIPENGNDIPKENKTTSLILNVVIVTVLMGIIFMVLAPLSDLLQNNIFGFYPQDYMLDMGLSDEYSVGVLLVTYIIGFIALAVIAPTVEELYFRGFLLPRVPKLKGYGLLFHSFLFALYHVWTPWMIITRTIGVYPLIYIVNKKKSIKIGIISHILVNTLDFIAGFVFISTII